ncbi:hypothetical protein B0T20DRAFT_505382 [Sordaria brevicollis]|uniref:Uncharacterized protein n=1 Tax=Sordaria brevicollis TaxID=83679 RepID=A0AAE0PJC8_SORBR|nr:hypothetical protein B0T20DRAFT_505382 [Sordaria brevicollis]
MLSVAGQGQCHKPGNSRYHVTVHGITTVTVAIIIAALFGWHGRRNGETEVEVVDGKARDSSTTTRVYRATGSGHRQWTRMGTPRYR